MERHAANDFPEDQFANERGNVTKEMQNKARFIQKMAPLSLLQAAYKSPPEFKTVFTPEPFIGGLNNLLAAISGGLKN